MTIFKHTSKRSAIWRINGYFLSASLQAAFAFMVWPTSKEWWAFAFLSFCFALTSLGAVFQALCLIWQLYKREKAFAEFYQKGPAPKSSPMASDQDLKKVGVIDDEHV